MRVVTPDKGELVFTEGTCFNEHRGVQMGMDCGQSFLVVFQNGGLIFTGVKESM